MVCKNRGPDLVVAQLSTALLAFVVLRPCLPSCRRSRPLKEASANLGMPVFQNWIMVRTKKLENITGIINPLPLLFESLCVVCGWVEVCIRKEDVVLLSRKGRGCLVCGRNTQVFWMLVFYYRMICSLVNDSSQEKWIRAFRSAGGFRRELRECCNACDW